MTSRPGTTPSPGNGPTTPPDAQAVSDQLRLYLILLVADILVTQLELPFRLAGILLGLVTIYLGIRLLVLMSRLRKTGVRPRGPVAVAVGLGLSGVLLVTLLAEAAYYPMAADLEQCRSGANTQTAKKVCEDAARDRLDRLVDRLSRDR